MKKNSSLQLVLVLALACFSFGASCPKNGTINNVKQCVSSVSQVLIKDLLPAVAAILASGGGSWKQQLTVLGTGFGKNTINCVVAQFLSSLMQPGKAVDMAVAGRAKDWLDEQNVQY